jgi:hypothetical protein
MGPLTTPPIGRHVGGVLPLATACGLSSRRGPLDYPPIGRHVGGVLPLATACGLSSRRGPRPIGADLEYADDLTLDRALEGRRRVCGALRPRTSAG